MGSFKVVIIGCGLAGGLLGNGLLHNNVNFTIFESDERRSTREGYQIRLGSAAMTGFRACLTEEQQASLYKTFGRSGGVISSAPILYDTNFKKLLDLTKFPAYTKSAPINRVILRNFLQEPLDAAGKVVFNKKLKEYDMINSAESSKVKITFEDGTTDECDLLISAEGSVSKINTQIGLNNIVQMTAKWGFLARGDLPVSKLLSLPEEVRQSPITVIKNGMVLFYSAYLPEGLRKKSQPHDGESGQDGLNYDEELGSLFWGLSVPKELCPGSPRDLDDKLGFLLELIKDWDPRFHNMLKAIDVSNIYVFQARARTPPSKNWREKTKKADEPKLANDRVWLMGDAIHAMLPSRGMGGNQSMHDAADMLPQIVQLAKSADDRPLNDEDYAEAVRNYESLMLPRAFKWVKASGGVSNQLYEPTGVTGSILLFFVARLLDLAHIVTIVRKVLGYKPVDDAPELPN